MLYQQPQSGPFRLDASNPIVQALALAWTASAPDIDLVTGKVATWEGTQPVRVPVGDQISRKFIGSGDLSFGARPDLNFSGLSNQTVFAEVFIPNTASVSNFILGRVQSVWDYSMSVSSANQQFSFGTGGTSGGNSVLAPAASVANGILPYQGRPVPICGTYDKINARLYLDGLQANSVALTTSFPSSSDQFAIGARGGGNQAGTQLNGAFVSIVLIFKRTLSAAEVASLSANPWQIFVDEDEEDEFTYYVQAGGSTSFSYTAAGGIVFSGTATRSRGAVRAPAGGITFGGSANQVRGARKTASGGVTLSGSAGILRRTARAAAGGLLIAGHAAVSFGAAVQTRLVSPTGGIIISGLAAIRRAIRRIASGGLTFAGTAPAVATVAAPTAAIFCQSTIMRAVSTYGSVAARTTSIVASGTIRSTMSSSSIMRIASINATAAMSAAALNRTANLL